MESGTCQTKTHNSQTAASFAPVRACKRKRAEHRCQHCDAIFQAAKQLHIHVKDKHSSPQVNRKADHKEKATKKADDIVQIECLVCKKLYRTKTLAYKCERSHGVGFKCQYCDRIYTTVLGRRIHVRSFHQQERNHQCSYCGKKFFNRPRLLIHEKTAHTGEKQYKCQYCDKHFVRKCERKQHELLIHSGVKDFQCDICGQRFALKSYLVRHERVHTGEKPYKCKYCENAFSSINQRRKHEKSHEGDRA